MISSIFFPPALVSSQIAQVNRPKILERMVSSSSPLFSGVFATSLFFFFKLCGQMGVERYWPADLGWAYLMATLLLKVVHNILCVCLLDIRSTQPSKINSLHAYSWIQRCHLAVVVFSISKREKSLNSKGMGSQWLHYKISQSFDRSSDNNTYCIDWCVSLSVIAFRFPAHQSFKNDLRKTFRRILTLASSVTKDWK